MFIPEVYSMQGAARIAVTMIRLRFPANAVGASVAYFNFVNKRASVALLTCLG